MKRWRQQSLEARPTVQGRIDDVTVGNPKGLRLGNSQQWEVVAHYSYLVAGQQYHGAYKRGFESELEAWDLAEALDARNVLVHYVDEKPAKSDLAEAEVQDLIESSRRAIVAKAEVEESVVPLFPHGKLWLYPLIILSGSGLAASLYILAGSLHGETFAFQFMALHAFVFVVFFPAVLTLVSIGRETGNSKDAWKYMFGYIPSWARYAFYAAFGVLITASGWGSFLGPKKVTADSVPWSSFAAGWILFYGFSLLTFVAACRIRVRLFTQCPKGHPSPPGARRCPVCNRPLWRVVTDSDRSSELQPL